MKNINVKQNQLRSRSLRNSPIYLEMSSKILQSVREGEIMPYHYNMKMKNLTEVQCENRQNFLHGTFTFLYFAFGPMGSLDVNFYYPKAFSQAR